MSAFELTEADYDALFAVMQPDMPRIWRDVFLKILAQLEGAGVLTVNVYRHCTVSSTREPQTAVYRVEWKPKLH